MDLKDDLEALEEGLKILLAEVEELKRKVALMEKENQHFREEIYRRDRLESIKNLKDLYDEGFHICHPYFAQSREGEQCLFCLTLLRGPKEQF
jgi:regulator of replication initiation timing